MKFLLGLFIVFIGCAIIYYSRQMAKITWRWKSAENVFGSTASAFAVIGMGIMIAGILLGLGVFW